MPFDAVTLHYVEDALADIYQYHNSLDNFIVRCGFSQDLLRVSRLRAETRASGGRFDKAPKRYVVQEILRDLSTLGASGDLIVARIIDQLAKGSFPQATPAAVSAIEALKALAEANRKTKAQELQDSEREAAIARRSAEREKEAKRAENTKRRDGLHDRFMGLMAETNAQQRGYLLEQFLNDLFEFEGLEPRGSFRIEGEQIDGSFAWRGGTHLLEAKWTKEKVAGAEFGAFTFKVEGKSADTRGLYVSIYGYTEPAIAAVNAKGALKFVCLDGAHIVRALLSEDGLKPILTRVWRHADETGEAYLPVNRL
ncbi:hypothetical protein [Sandarakinorhabdus oryzae]|uniref:hypothetical protein n=1 Tax=Sandarakinorhabdus oryzae TaxID=2675220 RepID=UPI0012E1776E|nr:hypothetical protein [Sandarakinorhabdus oryzae]